MTQDGDEGRDPGAAGNEGARALILDRSPYIAQDQAVARAQGPEFVGDPGMVEIALDGEFELLGIGKRGEGEGPLAIAPALAVDTDLGGLAGSEGIAGGPLE